MLWANYSRSMFTDAAAVLELLSEVTQVTQEPLPLKPKMPLVSLSKKTILWTDNLGKTRRRPFREKSRLRFIKRTNF